jgi:E3 ubiquitin-protein ligase MYCBP2
LTQAQLQGLSVLEDDAECSSQVTHFYGKEDYSIVNRFESHGGGWGYSDHSIEAIRFMCDTDVLIGGIGLFGGRGEYTGKVKVGEAGLLKVSFLWMSPTVV